MNERAALIARLRADVARLRNPEKMEEPQFRWIGEPRGFRLKAEVADDIEAVIALLEHEQLMKGIDGETEPSQNPLQS